MRRNIGRLHRTNGRGEGVGQCVAVQGCILERELPLTSRVCLAGYVTSSELWNLCILELLVWPDRYSSFTGTLNLSHQGDPGSIPGRVTPDFRMWESCRTMPMVGVFSRGSPVSPALSLRRCTILTLFTLIGSQDLDVKSHPNLFTHLPYSFCSNSARIFLMFCPRGETTGCTRDERGCINIVTWETYISTSSTPRRQASDARVISTTLHVLLMSLAALSRQQYHLARPVTPFEASACAMSRLFDARDWFPPILPLLPLNPVTHGDCIMQAARSRLHFTPLPYRTWRFVSAFRVSPDALELRFDTALALFQLCRRLLLLTSQSALRRRVGKDTVVKRQRDVVTGEQHGGMPFSSERLLTCSPAGGRANGERFAALCRQSDVEPVPRALRSQSEKRTAKPFRLWSDDTLAGRRRALGTQLARRDRWKTFAFSPPLAPRPVVLACSRAPPVRSTTHTRTHIERPRCCGGQNTRLPFRRSGFYSPPLPDFRMRGPRRTMPLVGGFPRGSPVSTALTFRRCSHNHLASPSSGLKTSMLIVGWSCASKVKKRGSDTGDTNTHA
ncbi:hypothetical protein PR048_014787 [Dryococelus australis]|uniref:Uncharacterized protein n=1 Tax=Dryococelus australis TaxID=614101 RepID=A0ABQ9HF56_9NEOP|nr:hypothetical protein PR048_014787 [Dryococelus australis]